MTFPNDLTIDAGQNGVIIQPMMLALERPHLRHSPGSDGTTRRGDSAQPDHPGRRPSLSDETGNFPCFNGGGGVRNWSGGALTLENVTIQNNTMPANGGGVCHQDA
jgi:hypothetical protein